MLRLMGGTTTLVLATDRAFEYSVIENALHEQGFLDGYTIQIRPHGDELSVVIQIVVPVAWISAQGVPEMPAAHVFRSVAEALREVHRSIDG